MKSSRNNLQDKAQLKTDADSQAEGGGGGLGFGTIVALIGGLCLVGFISMIALSGCGGGERKISDPEDLRFVVAEADNGSFKITRAMLEGGLVKRFTLLKRSINSMKPDERPYHTRMVVQDAVFQYELAKLMSKISVPDIEERVTSEEDKFRSQYNNQADADRQLAMAQLTPDSYRALIRQKILREAVISQYKKPYVPTEEEIDEYYMVHSKEITSPPAFRYSQILFRVEQAPAGTPDDKKEAFAKDKEKMLEVAQKTRERLVNGEDFAKLARELSNDVSTRDKGGDCGYVIEGTELPEVYKVVSTSKLNELSPVFESEYGYHITKTTESVPGGTASRASARKTIIGILNRLHDRNASQLFVKQVLDASKIVFHVPVADKPPVRTPAAAPATPTAPVPPQSAAIAPAAPAPAPAPAPEQAPLPATPASP